MSRAVSVLATGLYIEKSLQAEFWNGQFIPQKSQWLVAPEEVKEIFRRELIESLRRQFQNSSSFNDKNCIPYGYYVGALRGAQMFLNKGVRVASITQNLRDVIEKLPKLEDGATYQIPANTYLWFRRDRREEFAAETSKPICPWIAKAL